MIKCVLILASFIFFSTVSGQYCNVLKYYTNVNKAENELILSNYKSANHYYCKAFKYSKPFYNDLVNAISCLLLNENIDTTKLYEWSRLYNFQNSYPLELKINSKIVNEKTATIFKSAFKDSIQKSEYCNSIRLQLSQILADDQKIRHDMDEKYGVEKYWIEEARKKIMKVDSINLTKIDAIISDRRFNYFDIGSDGSNTIFIIMIHNSQWQRPYKVALKLEEKVKEGKFSNKIYAEMMDRLCDHIDTIPGKEHCINGMYFGENLYWQYSGINTYISVKEKELKILNKRRDEIYLCNYENAIEKLKFQVINPYFLFYKKTTYNNDNSEWLKQLQKLYNEEVIIKIE